MNVAATTAAEGFPRRAFTVEDIGRMIEAGVIREDEKFELIEGEIVMMAAKGVAHERIKSALIVAVVRALPDHLTIGVEATLRFTDTVMLEPDIAVFPKELFEKSREGFARLDPGEAHLVIEVAASSLAYDKGLKARLYARHRVRELWVVDANERTTWVHTGPSGDAWSSVVARGPQEALTTSPLPGFSIRLGEIA
jgi:Uma2 family endonuclease